MHKPCAVIPVYNHERAVPAVVADLLRESGVPVVEFRASIVLGSGSLSFEMIRALVERLPVVILITARNNDRVGPPQRRRAPTARPGNRAAKRIRRYTRRLFSPPPFRTTATPILLPCR